MPISANNTTLTFNNGSTQTVAPVNTNANVNSVTLTAGTAISVTSATTTGAAAATINNTGVTSIVAGSGISINQATGAVTVTAAGGGVTSLNGQTGAVTTTNFDSIGATGILMNTTTSDLGYNSTRAGSSLRYNFTCNNGAASAAAPFARRVNSVFSYSGGGTSIAGTWRKISTGVVYQDDEGQFYWYEALYVRIS